MKLEWDVRSDDFRQISNTFEEQRGLDHTIRRDAGDAHQGGETLVIQEGKKIEGSFTSINGPTD